MLNANNISISFGGEHLFDSISFRLGKGDRVGLIGKNGAGKSTLLKLIAKENLPSAGSFVIEKNCKIGYLPQDLDFENSRTLLEETYLAFEEIKKVEVRQEEILKIIEKENFTPKPKIDSAIMSFTRKSTLTKELIHAVNLMFSQRRKKLQNIGKKLGIEIKSDERLEEMTNDKIINFAKKIRKI